MKEKTFLRKRGTVIVLALLCCLLWGSAFPCIKLGYEWFAIDTDDTFSQILFAGLRFALAGAGVIAVGSIRARRFLLPQSGRTWRRCGILALVQTVAQYVFFYIGLAHTSGVKASVLEASNVFFAILLSALVFHQEKLRFKNVLGCLLGFGGVVLVNLSSGSLGGGFSLAGDGLMLLSAMAYAVSSVLIKSFSQTDDPVTLSGWQFFFGGLIMAAAGAAGGGQITAWQPKGIAMLLYLAFVSAAAYTIWGLLLKYNNVSTVTVIGFMNPVFGVLLSAAALGETEQALRLQNLAALLLVCAGIFAVNAANNGKKSKNSHSEKSAN